MSKITIPFREYNAMRISRVVLWILFVIVALFVVALTVLSFLGFPLTQDVVLILLALVSLALLTVSLLFLRKYRIQFFIASFYLLAACFFVNVPWSNPAIWKGPYPFSVIVFWFAAITLTLTAVLLTVHLLGKRPVSGAKWIAVVFGLCRILTAIIIIVSGLSSLHGAPQATPLIISLFIVQELLYIFPELLFAYLGYKAYSETYFNYFIRQSFSQILRENTILFS